MEGCAVVVGSGPAGLSAALYLSANGMDVTVIDRLSDTGFSRYHSVCGAGISSKAFGELDLIEPDCVRNRIRYTELVFPGEHKVRVRVRGYVLDRVGFLKNLKERCESQGCTFVNAEVVSVERDGDGFVTHTRSGDYCSRYIIGCDGAHSVVRRDLFGSRPKMMPVEEFVVGGEPDNMFRIFLAERYQGLYEWSFPCGGNRNVGSGCGMIRPDNVLSKGARHIPFGGVPRISEGNAYICGDAAGMANPVSGGGLRAAMVSGQNAAKEILGGRKGSYQRWWDGSILSSPRFMALREKLNGWTDEDFISASKLYHENWNPYLCGAIAGILHPKYIPFYIGGLRTFKETW